MKKLFIKGALLCTALFFTVQADAQISLGNILKNVVSHQKRQPLRQHLQTIQALAACYRRLRVFFHQTRWLRRIKS